MAVMHLIGIGLFLTHLAEYKKSIKSLRGTYPDYFISKNKIELENGFDLKSIFENIKKKYKNNPVNTEDGLKIEFDNDWVHLRTSNTEPIIRIYAESDFESKANNIALQADAGYQGVYVRVGKSGSRKFRKVRKSESPKVRKPESQKDRKSGRREKQGESGTSTTLNLVSTQFFSQRILSSLTILRIVCIFFQSHRLQGILLRLARCRHATTSISDLNRDAKKSFKFQI